ncbi:VHL domain-containing protein [Chloropicon roscoffensis]|uniref:VHL domain-containing protein n=1 Tax=Chloropicon roscoffensis TaxID=1461544 RepID=A0AAX4P4T0_9CHLO
MGNCNTRLLFGGTNTNARNMAAAAPASDNAYPQGASLMRSTSSDESTYILFENQTESRVKLYWLNYDGQEVAYRSIEPGRVHRQQTFMTHPWTFKLLDPGTEKRETDVVVDDRRVVFPNDDIGQRKAVLRKPSLWEWSPDNHKKHFPKKFLESTEAFLRVHHTQRRTKSAALTAEDWDGKPQVDLGVLPTELILRIIELSAPEMPIVLPPAPASPRSADA